MRLLVKNLGRGFPESVAREELEGLDIHVEAVMQLRSVLRDQDPTKDRPLNPTSFYQWRGCPTCLRYDQSLNSACLRMSVESYVALKCPLQCKRRQRFGRTQRNCGYEPRCVACGGAHLTCGCSTPREQPQYCGCGVNHTASYRGCNKWKEAKAGLAKRAPECVRKSARRCPEERRHKPIRCS